MSAILKRFGPQVSWATVDVLCFALAAALTAWLTDRFPSAGGFAALGVAWSVRVWFYVHTGMYRAVLRYSDVNTLITLTIGVALGSVIATFAGFFAFLPDIGGLGRVFLALEGMLSLALVGGSRFTVRYFYEARSRGRGERALVLGAGQTGEAALRLLLRSPAYHPVGLLDDDPKKRGAVIHGCRVLGAAADVVAICRQRECSTVVVAAELDSHALRALFAVCMEAGLRIKIARDVDRLLDRSEEPRLEELALEDLLRRPARHLDPEPVKQLLQGRRVLITGAGGSIGSDLARQVASFDVAQLILVDHAEPSLYAVDRFIQNSAKCEVYPVLLSLCDGKGLDALFATYKPQVVFHAAAYKHVPLVEVNPFTSTRNNVLAMREVLEACGRHQVDDLVLISSDKAVRPTNVMGATKRVCELMLKAWTAGPKRCCAVRFGNVLGSSGSVVPLFLDQIKSGGPVTVTDPEVTRYFMLIPEAVELVLQAAAIANNGDLFLLDMGDPIRIDHLARQLIYMTGRVPDVDICVEYTGLRPGEKLVEELLLTGEECDTSVAGVLCSSADSASSGTVSDEVESLLNACLSADPHQFATALKQLVPEWSADQRWIEGLALNS